MKNKSSEKFKIAFFVRCLDRGGVESFIFQNLYHMDIKDFDIDFLLTRNKVEAYDQDIIDLGCNKKVIVLKYDFIQTKNKVAKIIEKYIKLLNFFMENKYDLVYFHGGPTITTAIGMLAAQQAGIRVRILHSHCGKLDSEYSQVQLLKKAIGKFLVSKIATDYWACSDTAISYQFSKNIIRKKDIVIIHNAIDTKKFKYDIDVRKRIRNEWGIDENIKVIGNVSRFVKFKNHLFIVEIFKQLHDIDEKSILVLVGGEVSYEQGIRNEVEELVYKYELQKNVFFLGEKEEPHIFLNAMDAFVMPSFYEGFSIAGMEAICSGLPVFASDTITRQMKVIDIVSFLNINDEPLIWAKYIINYLNKYRREDKSDILYQKGYDIKFTSREIRDRFIERIIQERRQ